MKRFIKELTLVVFGIAVCLASAAVFSAERGTDRGAAAPGEPGAERGTAARGERGAGRRGGSPMGNEPIVAESRVLTRGGVELLTFESDETLDRLEQLYEGSLKANPEAGSYTRMYFRSNTDNSVQPYVIWLPPNYTPGKKSKMLVQLGGIGPKSVSGRRPNYGGLGLPAYVDTEGSVIHLHPMGRTNTFYLGMGEADVLQAIDEAMKRFSVDPQYVSIAGHSMGGAGSFLMAMHYPDRFAADTPYDPALGMMGELDTAPDWMKPQLAINELSNLYRNARNVKVYFKMAGAGIGLGSGIDFTGEIVAQGGFSTTEVFPGMPHYFGPMMSFGMFTRQATLLPIPAAPPEVKYYTNTLRYNSAYWATIDRLEKHNADAVLEAKYDDGKPEETEQTGRRGRGAPAAPTPTPGPTSLVVATSNISGMTLRLAGGAADPGASAPVTIDGQEVLNGALPETMHLAKTGDKWSIVDAPALAGKHHGVQGPVGDAFNSRFLAVYGDSEADKALAIAELDAIRNTPGRAAIQGEFPMKAASKVTAEDVQQANLILFGTPKTNAVLARIADKLPAALLAGTHNGGEGVVFIQPNPENSERYVVAWTAKLLSAPGNGLEAGFTMPINLLPDYVKVKAGKVVEGGFFDNDWRMPSAM